MKTIVINEQTRERVELTGKLVYLYANGKSTRFHIESNNLIEFQEEATHNENALERLGLDISKPEIAYRKSKELSEIFILPQGYGLMLG